MGSYSIRFKPSVAKDLRPIPREVVSRLMACIESLRDEPFPRQSVKLSGAERLYRVRVGGYRVVYEVDTQVLEVTVHYIRHRRDAYRDR
jgi:mRNA interferase RelE/StbE